MSGKVQVERYWKDTGKRQAATLPIEWRRGCEREVLNALHGINAAIAKGLSLKDAVRLTFDLTAGLKSSSKRWYVKTSTSPTTC